MRVSGAGGRFRMKKRGNPKGQIEWGVEGEIWCLFMDTCCENRKRGDGTGERGRTDKQMRFCVKKCNWWFGFRGHVAPVDWPCPAVSCPLCLTSLSWLTTWSSPLTGGLLSQFSPGQAPWPRAQPAASSPWVFRYNFPAHWVSRLEAWR